jgi:hypothetical protein
MNTLSIIDLENRLRGWVCQQAGPVTAEEAAEFLGMPQDSDGTYYAIPGIGKALENIGCEKEVLIHYWPPVMKLDQPEQFDTSTGQITTMQPVEKTP